MRIIDENVIIMTYTDHLLSDFMDFVVWAKWLFILAIGLTLTDLKFGISASKFRNEIIKRSRALRRTFKKLSDYLIWVFIAYVFGKAFGAPFGIKLLPLIILLVVYAIELESIFVNYFAGKGRSVKVDVFKFFKSKTDLIDVEEEKEEEKEDNNDEPIQQP